MNIYIYGNQGFKKEIYKILDNSSIKKLDNNVIIKEINNLKDLKEAIKEKPKDIYLIDDEKIIKKDSLKSKIFTPKDGIEEQFLIESGITDLSIDSLNEIPEYIIRKYELEKNLAEIKTEKIQENQVQLDDELSKLLTKEEKIEEKTENLVEKQEELAGVNLDELQNLIDVPEDKKSDIQEENFDNDFGLNNISFDYDDDNILNDSSLKDEDVLAQLLNSSSIDEDNYEFLGETFEDVNFLEEIFPEKAEFLATFEKPEKKQEEAIKEEVKEEVENKKEEKVKEEAEKFEDFEDFDIKENFEDEEALKDDKLEKKEIIIEPEENEETINEKKENFEDFKGDKMDENEFSELDSLNEKDLMEALNCSPDEITQVVKEEIPQTIISDTSDMKNKEVMLLNSSNVDEISQLISKLLTNKTLEITIKLKD